VSEEIRKVKIGPFAYDRVSRKVRMGAGVYTFNKPLTFVLPEGSSIEGVNFEPLLDFDSGATLAHDAVSYRETR
jgi:hypothetical protein